jgi:cytohesin
MPLRTGLAARAFGLIKGLDGRKIEAVKKHSIFQISCRATITLFILAWSSLVFGGEIHDAASRGDLEQVKTLLKADPDLVFSRGEGNDWTPLHEATDAGHKEVVVFLLANKAEVNAKNKKGGTPLHMAASEGYKEIAELLLANKAEVNARGTNNATPLHLAALMGHKDLVELLLAHKAEVNAKCNDGTTPLHWAVAKDHKDVAELLRKHGGTE